MYLPVLFLIWILPYAWPSQVTLYNNLNGVPLYIYLNAVFATVI
jgi:hypothetical protein